MTEPAPSLPPPTPAHSQAMAEAMARLELSRARLRHEMIPPAPPPPPPGSAGSLLPPRLRAWWRRLRRQGGGWALGSAAAAALGDWWQAHPWRPAGEMLAGEFKATALPLVRRHPLLVVGVAAGLGALLVSQRPWRWPGVAERVRPLPARLGRWVMHQLSQAPVQTALLSALMMMLRKPAPEASEPTAAGASMGPEAAAAAARQPSPTATPDRG